MGIPFRERITCTIDEAIEATGIRRRKLEELLPQIESKRVGRRRLILVRSLIERLEAGETATA
jgi:hypothetical protein